METASDIQKAIDYLISQEGTIKFLSNQTFLSHERVKRICDVGGGEWIYFDHENPPREWNYMEAARRGETKTQDGININTYLNASADMLQMDIDEMEPKVAAYIAAVERGETPEPIPGLKKSTAIEDHLKEKAKLSGESLETVSDVYLAELARIVKLMQLGQRINALVAKEEKDQKGGCL